MSTPGLNEAHFGFTGAQQDWTVPSGVTLVAVEVAGGNAAGLIANLTVTPGEVLHMFVGSGPAHIFGSGGWNGGADGPVAPLTAGGFPPQFVSAASSGATDVRRGGITAADRILVAPGRGGLGWSTAEGVLAIGFADGGEIDSLYGYTILGPQPGPSDPPRAPRTTPAVGRTLITPGVAGGSDTGAAGYLHMDSQHGAGAGGGGFGGGASGSVFSIDTPPPDTDTIDAAGGNTGGWFAAAPLLATATAGALDQPDGFVHLTWMASDSGWNVGHLAG